MSYVACFYVFIVFLIAGLECKSCDTQDVNPVVDRNWRNPMYVKHNQSDLYMTNKLIKEIDADELYTPEKMDSLARFLEKLRCGETVNVLVLGGSFTKGIGCNVPWNKLNTPFNDLLARNGEGHKEFCNWPTRFIVWLRGAYPQATINKVNYAYGGTTSLYGLNLIRQHKGPYDLCLVDYGMNDHDMPDLVAYVTEMIVRQAREAQAAVMYVAVRMDSDASEQAYERVCRQYSVPFVPYRRVLMAEISTFKPDPAYPERLHSPYYYVPLINHHPDWRAHQVLADMLAHYMIRAAAFVSGQAAKGVSLALPSYGKELVFKPVTTSSGSGEQGLLYCEGPLTEMTEMPGFVQMQPFEPYYKSDDPGKNPYQGWELRKDSPAKPKGWIAQSDIGDAAGLGVVAAKEPRVVFKVHLLKGEVSISYLSTYQNAGKVEIWLSYTDWENSRGYYESKEAGVIGCCSKKRWDYPSPFRSLQSHSAWLDTLDENDKISQTKVATFRFSYSGVFLLNIKHERLDADEVKRRGGDKVKILGIRTC